MKASATRLNLEMLNLQLEAWAPRLNFYHHLEALSPRLQLEIVHLGLFLLGLSLS